MSKVNLCLAALGAVSGFNHYTPHYFEWKQGHDDIVATFQNEMAAVRSSEHDAAKRMEMMDVLLDKMDDAIIALTDHYYPRKDGNWSEPEEGSPAAPALVVNNDGINGHIDGGTSPETGDGGSTIGTDQVITEETPPEPAAIAVG